MLDKLAVWRFSPTGRAFEFGLERTALTFRLQTAANQCRRESYQRDLNLKRPNFFKNLFSPVILVFNTRREMSQNYLIK